MKKKESRWVRFVRGLIKILLPGYYIAQKPAKGTRKAKGQDTAGLLES